jgi:Kdo2-lipid IVA lauroyltransferase/acyltransferase
MKFSRNQYPKLILPLDILSGWLAYGFLFIFKAIGADRASNFGAKVLAPLGYYLVSQTKVGRENLTLAFPEKSSKEIETILKGVWVNLCRTVCEYATMDEIWDFDETTLTGVRISTDALTIFEQLRDDGKPALIFAAHLANWELPAVAAAAHGLDATALYRMPNNPYVAKAIMKLRSKTMGKMVSSSRTGVLELARAVESGSHVGMLIDQRLTKGVKVQFFGQEVTANPTIARLAKHFDCPVHGVRIIRGEGVKFHISATEEIVLPRDETGKIDVQPAMQMLTTILEGWIREKPEQWLWLHRRFRN